LHGRHLVEIRLIKPPLKERSDTLHVHHAPIVPGESESAPAAIAYKCG
jgi:hypothetical protein